MQSIALQSGSTGAASAPMREGDEQVITLTTSEENAQGEFLAAAQRLSNAVPLKLVVRQGDSTITRSLSASVVGTKPALKVSFSPKSIAALADNVVTFKVSDFLGLPVKEAYVAIGDSADALKGAQVDGTYSEGKDGSATYRIEGVRPVTAGTVSYSVAAAGFKTTRGTIPVSAKSLIELDSKALSLSLDSREQQQLSFSITNLLEDSVPVTLQIQLGQTPKYTYISLDSSSLRLKPRQASSAALQARLLDSVLQVAARARTLGEKVTGRIRVYAKLAGSTQEESIPFTVTTSFSQQDLNALWQLSSDSLQFSLAPPKIPSDMAPITVTNDGPYPILVNTEAGLPRIFSLDPLSSVIESGASAEFKVIAKAVPVDACAVQPDERNSSVAFFVSTQGITSKRSVNLGYSAKSSASCRVVEPGNDTAVTATPTPACALTVEPSIADINSDVSVTIAYSDFAPSPNSFEVICGAGKPATNAAPCTGQSGTCSVKCRYSKSGSNTLTAKSGSVLCSPASVEVSATRSSCALTIEPSSALIGAPITVTANYYDLPRAPNAILISCGNGRPPVNAPSCTGTTGTCTAKCSYAENGSFTISSAASGVACSQVQVDITSPQAEPTEPGVQIERACAITPEPAQVQRNQKSLLTIQYYDLERAPNVIAVNCGNGKPASATQCTGTTGTCFANCTYSVEGTFKPLATASGVICTSDSIEAAAAEAVEPPVAPVNGVRIQLPVQIMFQFPAKTEHKANPDGSEWIKLPNGDSMLFEQGAQVGDLSSLSQYSPYRTSFTFTIQASGGSLTALIPPGVFFTVPRTYASKLSGQTDAGRYPGRLSETQSQMADYAYEFRFPFNSFLDFDTETEFAREGAYQTASIDDFDVTIPSAARIIREPGGSQRRAALSPQSPIKIALTPFISSRDAFSVFFPVEAVFLPQEFVRVKRDEFNGNKAIQFRSGTTISLPADAVISSDAQDFKRISIPAGSELRIPAPYAQQDFAGRLMLQFPFRVSFKASKDGQVSVNTNSDGLTVRSISDDRVDLSFYYGMARAGMATSDGNRLIDVSAGTQMMLAPAEFGVYGDSKQVPAGFSMSLLQNVNVRNVPTGEGTLVEFSSRARMLVEGAQVTGSTPRGEKKLEVLAGTTVVFDKRILRAEESSFGQESYSITFPVASVWHFPKEATVSGNKITTTSYEASFPSDFAPQLSVRENFQDLALPAGQPIVFTTVDQELAKLQGHDFEFKEFPFPVEVSLAKESFKRFMQEMWKNSLMNSFRMNNPVTLTITDPDTLDKFETDVTRVLAKQTADESLASDPLTFSIPSETLFVLRIAPADEAPAAEAYRIKGIFTSEVNYILPKGVPELAKDSREATLGGCMPVGISRAGRKYSISQVKKIIFPPTFLIPPKQKAAATDSGDKPAAFSQEQVVSVPNGDETIFVLCEKPSKGSTISISDDVMSVVLSADPTEFSFTNADSWQTKPFNVCVQNFGSSQKRVFLKLGDDNSLLDPVAPGKPVTGPDNYLEGDSIAPTKTTASDDLAGAFRSVIKPGAWNKDETAMTLNERQFGQDCANQRFRFEVAVPKKFTDEYECLIKGSEGRVVDGEIRAFVRGTTRFASLPFKITLSESGECAGNRRKQLAAMLGGFYINYANDQKNLRTKDAMQVLVFKNEGHARWISMVNNYDEDLVVTYTSQTRTATDFVKCEMPAAEGKPGLLKSGTGFISKCTGEKEGEGTIEFTATGETRNGEPARKTVKTVKAVVGKLSADYAKIFASTPLGDLAPQEPQGAVTPLAPSSDSAAVPAGSPGAPGTPATAPAGAAPATGGTPPIVHSPSGYSPLYFADAPAAGATPPTGQPKAPTPLYQPAPVKAASADTITCQTHFCTAGQVAEAYKGFAVQIGSFLDQFYSAPDDATYLAEWRKFCQPSDARLAKHNADFSKSIIVQVANSPVAYVDQKVVGIRQAAEDAFEDGLGKYGQAGSKKLAVTWAAHVDFSSCGIYILKARLGVCTLSPPTREQWLKSSFLDLSVSKDPTQFVACNETLANAALLTADKPEVIIGKEPNANALSMNEPRKGDKAAIGLLESVRIFSMGPYKEIASKQDDANARVLVKTLYGYDDYPLSQAVPYEDKSMCFDYGWKSTRLLMAYSAPAIVVAAGGTALGGGAYFGPRLGQAAYSLVSGIALCSSVMAADSVNPSRVGFCQGVNSCLAGQTYTFTELYLSFLPGGGATNLVSRAAVVPFLQQVGRKLGSEFISNLAITAAMSGAFGASNEIFGTDIAPGITPPQVPAVLAAAKVLAPTGNFIPFGSRAFMVDTFLKQGRSFAEANTLVGRFTTPLIQENRQVLSRALSRLARETGVDRVAPRTGTLAPTNFDNLVTGSSSQYRVQSYVEDLMGAGALNPANERRALFDAMAQTSTLTPVTDSAAAADRMKSMFDALGKPGNEELRAKVINRLDEAIPGMAIPLPKPPGVKAPMVTLKQYLEQTTDTTKIQALIEKEFTTPGRATAFDLRLSAAGTPFFTDEELVKLLRNYDETAINSLRPAGTADVITEVTSRVRARTGIAAPVAGGVAAADEGAILSQVRQHLDGIGRTGGSIDDVARAVANDIDGVTSGAARARYASFNSMMRSQRALAVSRTVQTLGALIAPFLFYVEMRPVRAELDYRLGNHILVYNNRESQPPSMQEYCFRDESDLSQCTSRVNAELLCPDSADSCIYLSKGLVLAKQQQYNLVTAFNKGVIAETFIPSLFDANSLVDVDSVADPVKVKSSSTVLDFRTPQFQSATGVQVDDQRNLVKTIPRDASEILLERFRKWCDNDGCPQAVEDALKPAQQAFDEGRYGGSIEILRKAAGIPNPQGVAS
ncbi:MAG: hypothetical protein V1708_01855 [Candidatus Micrarchaeota archaeon]